MLSQGFARTLRYSKFMLIINHKNVCCEVTLVYTFICNIFILCGALYFQYIGLVEQVIVVAFSNDVGKIFRGGIHNKINVWDLCKNEVSMKLQSHTKTITSMQLSLDRSYLPTNSIDCTLRVQDMKPYASHVPFFLFIYNLS